MPFYTYTDIGTVQEGADLRRESRGSHARRIRIHEELLAAEDP